MNLEHREADPKLALRVRLALLLTRYIYKIIAIILYIWILFYMCSVQSLFASD